MKKAASDHLRLMAFCTPVRYFTCSLAEPRCATSCVGISRLLSHVSRIKVVICFSRSRSCAGALSSPSTVILLMFCSTSCLRAGDIQRVLTLISRLSARALRSGGWWTATMKAWSNGRPLYEPMATLGKLAKPTDHSSCFSLSTMK